MSIKALIFDSEEEYTVELVSLNESRNVVPLYSTGWGVVGLAAGELHLLAEIDFEWTKAFPALWWEFMACHMLVGNLTYEGRLFEEADRLFFEGTTSGQRRVEFYS